MIQGEAERGPGAPPGDDNAQWAEGTSAPEDLSQGGISLSPAAPLDPAAHLAHRDCVSGHISAPADPFDFSSGSPLYSMNGPLLIRSAR